MPANIDPVYSKIGRLGNGATTFVSSSTVNASLLPLGTVGTDMFLAFTADATNGSFLRSVVAKCAGTATGNAFLLRLWLNNGSAPATATAANNTTALFRELFIPAITPSATVASPDYEIPCNVMLPPSYRVLYTISSAPGNAWWVYGVGGDY